MPCVRRVLSALHALYTLRRILSILHTLHAKLYLSRTRHMAFRNEEPLFSITFDLLYSS